MAVQRPSQRLDCRRLFFYPLTGTEHGSQPALTTRDRELVSVLEVRIEPRDLNPRPLTPQFVTLPTLPQAGLSMYSPLAHSRYEGAYLLRGVMVYIGFTTLFVQPIGTKDTFIY